MSGFANPFAQFNENKSDGADKESLVTTSYLTGLPNPKSFADDHVALIFKQLLKRDARTKQRALLEFGNWLDDQASNRKTIDDNIHLAYIQVYAKLSLENVAEIRSQAHSSSGKMYHILGKASSKYLKYSVGPWWTARFDPDIEVVKACEDSLALIFPEQKQQMSVERFQPHIVAYIYDACARATAQSSSDIRYYSTEEQSQKYRRLVKCCIDSMTADPRLFDIHNSEILDLSESGRLWKYFSSADSMLSRSALRLAQRHLTELEPWVTLLWKELSRAARKRAGGSGISLEVLQFMNVLTKKNPEVWELPGSTARKDAFASLAQFVSSEPPHSARFWPLFYNLVSMVPSVDFESELSLLYKPSEKVVSLLKFNHEIEESAWGCFVSLAGKMGPKYVSRAFAAAERRCSGPSVPVKSISRYLSRLADLEVAKQTVRTQLHNFDKVPFEYLLTLAYTHKFRDILDEMVVPKLVAANRVLDLGSLVGADPELKVPSLTKMDDLSNSSSDAIDGWIEIAVNSNYARSQQIIDTSLTHSTESSVRLLNSAQALKSRGVKLDLNEFVVNNFDDAEILRATVAANGSGFVSHSNTIVALRNSIELALLHDDQLGPLTRSIKDHSDFVNSVVGEDDKLREDLEILASDDRKGVIRMLTNLKIGDHTDNAHKTGKTSENEALLDSKTCDLTIPVENIANPLRAQVPSTALSLEEGLVECEVIAESVLPLSKDTSNIDQALGQCLIIESYLKSWLFVLPGVDQQDMPMTKNSSEKISSADIKNMNNKRGVSEYLWSCLESSNYSFAYHAAQAMVNYGPISSNIKASSIQYSRDLFSPKPSSKGAVLAYFSAVQDVPQYDQMQRAFIREAMAGSTRDEDLMVIDRSYIPDSATLQVDEEAPDHIVKVINTFTTKIVNLDELAFQSADRSVEYAAFLALPANQTNLESVLEFASSLPDSGSGMDQQIARQCLLKVKTMIDTGSIDSHKLDTLSEIVDFQSLLDRDDLLEIPWLCLLVPEVSQQLKLDFESTTTSLAVLPPSVVVSWLLLMQTSASMRPEVPEKEWQNLWTWISKSIDFNTANEIALSDFDDYSKYTLPPSTSILALWLLYEVSKQYPNSLRSWYRDLRDRNFIKQLDRSFSTLITPAILESSSNVSATEPHSILQNEGVDYSVNGKQREIRATREVEDEFAVEIIIALPEQFPCKPATVSIKNLAGVSEAKKRGWLLEARHHLQDGGVMAALVSVLNHLNNFLEGVEPCAICYMTVNDLNKLPNKSCSSCHNLYHAECSYKWFTTNTNNRLCPMCRNPM